MMNTTNFADANKASVENFFGLTGQAFEGVEQLATLNLQVIKTLMTECAETGKALMAAKSTEEFMKLQTAALQGGPEKAVAYGRQVSKIMTAAGASQRAAFEVQRADMQAKFLGAVEGALKNAPGSEQAKKLMKSTIDAANNAYEGASKASKQITDAVDANVKKVAETAITTARNTRTAIEA